jgi:DNA-binding MarR family transcriptional regulator
VSSAEPGPPAELAGHLGYLFKHARQRLGELTTAALAPYGVEGRELAVLLVLVGSEPPSQQEAALRLGVDRTTMVALLDVLEDKGFVVRRPHAHDRRKNVVALTELGADTLAKATKASEQAERDFLGPVGEAAGQQLKEMLLTLITARQDRPVRRD